MHHAVSHCTWALIRWINVTLLYDASIVYWVSQPLSLMIPGVFNLNNLKAYITASQKFKGKR